MALSIEDAETERLARELAVAAGETITEALRSAVQERLARVRQPSPRDAVRDTLSDIVRRGRARGVVGARPADEILGYGPDGFPT